ncbi:hypothetical protein EII34_14305 [Arachnia propionica]|uniref:Uncharacterized protein n=1 Tax=Arachnia propionica TaxID=1750 RepID=A0A3P1T1M8_9ACTN|nr:hypothetical protein [Arachnia propionica]RRD03362.1 hypothetical protein EII34_14305 [Arachnia propionica]
MMTPTGPDRPLRRRDLLLATTAFLGCSALGLTGCSATPPPPTPSPSPAPAPGQIPVDFADRPAWPEVRTMAVITAVKDQYLTGMTLVWEGQGVFSGGWVPVLVDVTGPTTWALLIDETGAWTTWQVELKGYDDKKPEDPGTALTGLVEGPVVFDDDHVYLCVGVVAWESPETMVRNANSYSPSELCHVVVVKIRLSDKVVVASQTVSERYSVPAMADQLRLSFSRDRSSLLISGGHGINLPSSDADWIGMRLSTSDLGVEFDAHTHYGTRTFDDVDAVGQGVVVASPLTPQREVISLETGKRYPHDGRTTPLPDDPAGALVVGDWVYLEQTHRERTATTTRKYVVNMTSGEESDLPDPELDLPQWATVFSDQPLLLDFSMRTHLAVWAPGDTEPRFTWQSSQGQPPWAAATFGDFLYALVENDGSVVLQVMPIGQTQPIAEIAGPPYARHDVEAVSTWGLVTKEEFFPATRWLDQSPSPTPTASPS